MCDSHDQGEHEIDWACQNELHKQWLINNPNAQYIGWMSI